MPTSTKHDDLTEAIRAFVVNEYTIDESLLHIDHCSRYPTKIIGKSRPDLFYEDDQSLIIGEAKTLNDFSTTRSLEQVKTFFCHAMHARHQQRVLVFAVQLFDVPSVKDWVRKELGRSRVQMRNPDTAGTLDLHLITQDGYDHMAKGSDATSYSS